MKVAYTLDAKHAVDKMVSECNKIEISRIFNSMREFEASISDDNLYLAATECTEAYARHMVKNLGFSHKDTNYYAS